jgi:predicted ATP-grasp superfamily ATP-dependent carboligase
MSEFPCVIITGADTPTGLTTARALRGLPVTVSGIFQNRDTPSIQSRHWDRVLYLPGSPDEQLDTLIKKAEGAEFPGRPLLLFSQDSHVISAWARLEELDQYFTVPIPPQMEGEIMMDKTLFHQWALENEVDVPQSEIVASLESLIGLAPDLSFPCILKPRVRTPAWDSVHKNQKFFLLNSEQELHDFVRSSDSFRLFDRYILQEWIPGGDTEVFFVLFAFDENGVLLAEYAGQKVWQWPPLGGSTAVCRLIEEPQLVSLARTIAIRLKMTGLGSIEFKRDTRTGKFLVTEPTVGRNDYQSGVALSYENNPTAALVRKWLGLDKVGGPALKTKANCIWVDELSAYRYAKSMGLLKASIQLIRTLGFFRHFQFMYFDWRDTKPFLAHLKKAFSRKYPK